MQCSLEVLASHAATVDAVRAGDVQPGDWLIVRTRNSTYALRANVDGTFDATGGWFARNEALGVGLRIAGCTLGGSVLLTRILAAPGMFLEFGNHVRTTRICEVRLIRPEPPATVH